MAICEKCIKQSVCKLCDGTEIMGCIEFVSVDCISRTRAIERLKLNFPISQGADNSRDRHRYMQALADLQAIKELPSVTPQLSSGLDKNSKKLEKNFGELDCISRVDALDSISIMCSAEELDIDFEKLLLLRRAIKALPSVTPQEPKVDLDELKRKILMEVDGARINRILRYCDVCDRISDSIDKYKAEIEPQKSEDRNDKGIRTE